MTKRNYTHANNIKQEKRWHTRSNAKEFAEKASVIHNNKYSYDKVVYKTNKDKVIITCPIHGDFEQRPDKHITGRGCKKCGGTYKSNTKEFVSKALKVHGNRYDYSKVKYKASCEKIVIVCRKHGEFEQTPNHHLKGRRCPKCRKETTGFGRTKFINACERNNQGRGYLYVINCFNNNEQFYKVGVTSSDLESRFHRKDFMPYQYKIEYLVEQEAEYIFNLENRIHVLLGGARYQPKIHFDGHTECFKDIDLVRKLLARISQNKQLQLIA